MNNLPIPLTEFIGREEAVVSVVNLLAQRRLVTLTGPGGIGKTRLALEVAASIEQNYRDGVWLVELGALAAAELVPQAIAAALGIPERKDRSLMAVVAETLASKQILLILDNCEHLIDACARQAESLVQRCGGLTVLATSREPLKVPGEAIWLVPPLASPPDGSPAEQLPGYPVVKLFAERAQTVAPDLSLTNEDLEHVANIGRRLDGIPLAIELAAAWARVLRPAQIAALLDNRFRLLKGGPRTAPQRQQALRATLDWSYDLLNEQERSVFARLSVFAGGCTLEAAEKVCGYGVVPPSEVVEMIARLMDTSLVIADGGMTGPMRYRQLETIREYAKEKLEISGETSLTRQRHALYFLALSEEAGLDFGASGLPARVAQLAPDYDNVRAALRWLIDQGEHTLACRLGVACAGFWTFAGHFAEGRAWVAELLALPVASPALERPRLLTTTGTLAWMSGDFDMAEAALTQAVNEWDAAGAHARTGQPLSTLGSVARMRGDIVGARGFFARAAEVARSTEQTALEANISYGLGLLAYDEGDLGAALDHTRRALDLATRAGWDRIGLQAVRLEGEIALLEGNHAQAAALLEEALIAARKLDSPWSIALVLGTKARLALAEGPYEQARAYLAECLAHWRQLGVQWGIADALEGMAGLAAAQREDARAARLTGAAAALRERIGAPLPPTQARILEEQLSPARIRLGPAEFAALRAAGAAALDDTLRDSSEPQTSDLSRGSRSGSGTLLTSPLPLTPREREVAALVAQGLSNLEIGRKLFIGERTVETHVSHILNKLSLNSRARIASWSVEHGLSIADSPARRTPAPP